MTRPQDPLLGKVLDGRFEMLDRIGEGGMGVVYRSRQITVDRVVAIKVLNAQVAQDPQWVGRFINEAKACSKLQHPNTVRLIDFGQTREGMLFMAMEFLDGQSIRAAIDRYGRMQPQRVLKIISQCCQSLAEAHNLGIIHRDIKPDNLFLVTLGGQPDFVKVLDFSVAKLKQQSGSAMQTQAGVVFGTPNYMSPEQGRGLPLDARSDIYALGIVAYEMLVGRPPFSSQNPMEVLAMHVRTPVPPLVGIPDRVSQIVMRALNKDPAHRQQTVEQLHNECQSALVEMGNAGPPHVSGQMAAQQPPMMNQQGQPRMHQQHPGQQHPGQQHPGHQHPGQQHPGHQQQMPPPQRGMPPQQQMPMPPQQHGHPGHHHQNQMSNDPARTVIAMPQGQMGPGGRAMPMPPMPQPPPSHTPPASGPGRPLRPPSGQMPRQARKRRQQADALFWALCIIAGILIGVIAYVIVAKASH